MLVLARVVDRTAIKDIASTVTRRVNRDAFLIGETEHPHFQTFVFSDIVKLRHCRQFCQDFVQVRIVLERFLQKTAQVAQCVRNTGKEMRFLLEISPETIGAKNLKGPEKDKQAKSFVEMLLIDLRVALQCPEISLDHLLAKILRVS